MKYPYTVKQGGTWYYPGEDVPDETTETIEETPEIENKQLEIPIEEVPKKRGRKPAAK